MFDGGNIVEFQQNDNTFYIRPFDPFQSIRLLGDLQKLVSPVIGNVFSSLGGESSEKSDVSIMDKKIDMGAVEKAFAALAEHVDGQKLESMAMRILDKNYVSVSIDGAEPVRLGQAQINELFTGNVTDMLILIVEVLRVNYGDFTKLFGSLSGKVGASKSKK